MQCAETKAEIQLQSLLDKTVRWLAIVQAKFFSWSNFYSVIDFRAVSIEMIEP